MKENLDMNLFIDTNWLLVQRKEDGKFNYLKPDMSFLCRTWRNVAKENLKMLIVQIHPKIFELWYFYMINDERIEIVAKELLLAWIKDFNGIMLGQHKDGGFYLVNSDGLPCEDKYETVIIFNEEGIEIIQ